MAKAPKIAVWKWRATIIAARISAPTKLLLLVLSHHFSDAARTEEIKAETLAIETGLSKRSVTTHIGKARAAGLLIVAYRYDQRGRRCAMSFTPAWAGEQPDLGAGGASRDDDLDAGDADSDVTLNASLSSLDAGDADRLSAGGAPHSLFHTEDTFPFSKRETRTRARRERIHLDLTAELDPNSEAMTIALQAGLTEQQAMESFRNLRDFAVENNKSWASERALMARWSRWARKDAADIADIQARAGRKRYGRASTADIAAQAFDIEETSP